MSLRALLQDTIDQPSEEEIDRLSKIEGPLWIKAGFDPTRPDLHLGHAVLLRKLRQFQEAGHEVILVIGDFTAMVGDPTGKSTTRPKLTQEEVAEAAATYRKQVFKYLLPQKTYTVHNSQWYGNKTAADLIGLASLGTVAQMIERADFSARFKNRQPIYLHEFLYPLLQGWDSVEIAREFGRCDIEFGGTDQLFNLLVGRTLMNKEGLVPQAVVTMPLLEGTDARMENGKVVGPKMSKSTGNYIGLAESPDTILHKVMLLDDAVVPRFVELLSDIMVDDSLSPKALKEAFGHELVETLHGLEEATKAVHRRALVSQGEAPEDTPIFVVPDEGTNLAYALHKAGITKSKSEAMRLIAGGAVLLDNVALSAKDKNIQIDGRPHLVRVGSKTRRFVKFVSV